MPKVNNNNSELIKEYLEHIKKEKSVSEGTLKTYKNIGESLPFSLLTSQPVLIKKLKDLYSNANTLQLYLNMIILVRRYKDEDTDKLIKFRNSLRDEIIESRKKNLDELDDKLPKVDYIMNELNNLTGIRYVLNYLIIEHGLRNKDLNLQFVKVLPKDKTNNYILNKNKYILLDINDYKTDTKYGNKQIKITDEKFINEFKSLNLKNEDHLLSKKDKTRIDNISTFNDKVLNLTIMKLGQNRLIKIVIRNLLNNKKFQKLEQISLDRGTSLSVLLKSYNLLNGLEEEKEKEKKE
jgi:hypothetical protein